MKTKFLSTLALAFMTIHGMHAQADFLPTPPSIHAQTYLQNINHQVSHYTGALNVEIPIHTVCLKDIEIPVSLTYNTSGIKVEQEASVVGLGWVLNAGGVITKTIIGENDTHEPYTYFNTDLCNGSPHIACNNLNDITGFYGPIDRDFTLCDYLAPLPSWTHFVTGGTYEERFNALNNTVYDTAAGGKEFAPDIFNYSFGNHSGTFIIKRDRSIVKEVEDNVVVEPVFSSDMRDIAEWRLTDTDGTTYIFSTTEKVEYRNLHKCNGSWYLSRIETVRGSVITFEYNNEPRQYQTFSRYQQSGSEGATNGIQIKHHNYSECKYIKRIVYNGGYLLFRYTNDRQDAKWLPRLKEIERWAAGAKQSVWEFGQSYFIADRSDLELPSLSKLHELGLTDDGYDSNWNNRRLRLDKVMNIPVDQSDTASYLMHYVDSGLPTKLSTAMDHWGYYNGRQNAGLIGRQQHDISDDPATVELESGGNADREPDPAYNQAFILSRITYPTGGSTTFSYETNRFDPSYMTGDPYKAGYYYTKEEVILEEGQGYNDIPGTVISRKTVNIPSGEACDMPFRIKYEVEADVACYNSQFTADMSLTMRLVDKVSNAVVWNKVLKVDELPKRGEMTTEQSLFEGGQNLTLPHGEYEMQITGSLRKVIEKTTLTSQRTRGPKEFLRTNAECYGGGLRISQSSTWSDDSSLILRRRYEYLYTGQTSGRLMSFPRYSTGCRTFSSEGLRNKGYSVGYTRVRVYESGAGGTEFGSIEYDFINKPDSNYCYSWTSFLSGHAVTGKAVDVNPQGVLSRRYAENGTLTAERFYDGNKMFYKLIDHTYEVRNDQFRFVWGLAKDYNNINVSEPAYWDQEALNDLRQSVNIYTEGGIPMSYLYPAVQPTRVLKTGTRETFHENRTFMYIYRTYEYDTSRPDFLTKECIEYNDGIKDTISYTYPFHYDSSIMNAMTAANMVADPGGHVRKYAYDGLGRLIQTTEQDTAESAEHITNINIYNYKNQ